MTVTETGTVDARLRKQLNPPGPGNQHFLLDVHLHAAAGTTVLFGPSGSGKTLTLNCVAGLSTPDQGRILIGEKLYFDGEAGVNLPPERRRCGYVFQDDALFPHLTIVDNLRFAGSVRRLRGLALRRRINDLLEAFELTGIGTHKPAQLSGGQRQRAALARVLIGDPQLLLLDEPTRGLESRLRYAFYEILRSTQRRLGVPLLLVTHDIDECFALADSICLMQDGHFLQCGAAAFLLKCPDSLEAARLLTLFTIVPAEIRSLDPGRDTSVLRIFEQELDGPYLPGHLIGDRGFLCARSSEVQLNPPARNGVSVSVLHSEPAPAGVRIILREGITLVVSEARFEELRSFERLTLSLPKHSIGFLTN